MLNDKAEGKCVCHLKMCVILIEVLAKSPLVTYYINKKKSNELIYS